MHFSTRINLTWTRDSPELHLSSQQRDVFAGWKRPKELLLQKHAGETDIPTVPAMAVTEKTDLVQDMVTDCSVVASLCAITSRYERGIDKVSQVTMES